MMREIGTYPISMRSDAEIQYLLVRKDMRQAYEFY